MLKTGTVADIADEELLRRAVKCALDRDLNKGVKHSRRSAVSRCFELGSTYSAQLCERFGFDPDEEVSR